MYSRYVFRPEESINDRVTGYLQIDLPSFRGAGIYLGQSAFVFAISASVPFPWSQYPDFLRRSHLSLEYVILQVDLLLLRQAKQAFSSPGLQIGSRGTLEPNMSWGDLSLVPQ